MAHIDFPGLLIEKHRNGSPRYRVRVAGNKTRRIHIPVGPDHLEFLNHYHSARAGEVWTSEQPQAVEQSLDWLKGKYLDYLTSMVSVGHLVKTTLRERRSLLTRVCDFTDPHNTRYGDFDLRLPAAAFLDVRDAWADRPGVADNIIKVVRTMYSWAIERGLTDNNPASGIAKINRKTHTGATPWTAADLKAFKKKHPPGTTAHLWLTLQAFTACRIGDAIWLGRDNEVTRDGRVWLEWQPRKKGSAPVSIPMMPPLLAATRASKIVGPAYILSERGKPFKSTESLRRRVRKWCDEAKITDRSSHGIRKAVAELLAESGCTQHQIMAVMAHTQSTTSEVYTKGVRRRALAAGGMEALEALEW
ncbi:tyrosine-type recombinase/integrase [Halovulum sp. GXIMD14793]